MKHREALILIGVTAVAALIVGCAAALPTVGPVDAERVNIPIDLLRDGRELYIAKCSGCHALYAPSKYTTAEWSREIDEMSQRSRLTDEDEARIAAYLHAFAKAEGAEP